MFHVRKRLQRDGFSGRRTSTILPGSAALGFRDVRTARVIARGRWIGQQLREMFLETTEAPLPEALRDLLDAMDREPGTHEAAAKPGGTPAPDGADRVDWVQTAAADRSKA